MKIQDKAFGVLERTSHYLKSGVLRDKPVWFDVVGANPPSTDMTKKAKLFEVNGQREDPGALILRRKNNYIKTRSSTHDRKQQNNSVSRVPKLEFIEDKLRDVFYHQHPWEFSRPKTLIENKGDEWKRCDWSHMLQLYKPLDGESVVQRTLWLLQNNQKKGKRGLFEAYDQARYEFYRLRMEEEMSLTVSREESSMFGAIYPSTNIEHGLKREQEFIDVWTQVAADETRVKEANRGGKVAAAGAADEATEESIWDTFAKEEKEEEEEKK